MTNVVYMMVGVRRTSAIAQTPYVLISTNLITGHWYWDTFYIRVMMWPSQTGGVTGSGYWDTFLYQGYDVAVSDRWGDRERVLRHVFISGLWCGRLRQVGWQGAGIETRFYIRVMMWPSQNGGVTGSGFETRFYIRVMMWAFQKGGVTGSGYWDTFLY